jgi:hypothetical protein
MDPANRLKAIVTVIATNCRNKGRWEDLKEDLNMIPPGRNVYFRAEFCWRDRYSIAGRLLTMMAVGLQSSMAGRDYRKMKIALGVATPAILFSRLNNTMKFSFYAEWFSSTHVGS